MGGVDFLKPVDQYFVRDRKANRRNDILLLHHHSRNWTYVIQQCMSLRYERSSEPQGRRTRHRTWTRGTARCSLASRPPRHTKNPKSGTWNPTPEIRRLLGFRALTPQIETLAGVDVSSSSVLLSSLELSDTTTYEPEIRALLGTAPHFCSVIVLKLTGVDVPGVGAPAAC